MHRLSFYAQILRHAFEHNFNPEPLLVWTYLSEHYFQHQSHQAHQDLNRCHVPFNFSLSLEDLDFTADSLETTLKLLKPVYIHGNCTLEVSFFQRFSPSIAQLLPLGITDLRIVGRESINGDVVPACIATLSHLRRLNITLFGGDYRGCTHTPVPRGEPFDKWPSITLWMERGGTPRWLEDLKNIKVTNVVSELEREVGSWFALSNSLQAIKIRFQRLSTTKYYR
jgi:hypothetical protein